MAVQPCGVGQGFGQVQREGANPAVQAVFQGSAGFPDSQTDLARDHTLVFGMNDGLNTGDRILQAIFRISDEVVKILNAGVFILRHADT